MVSNIKYIQIKNHIPIIYNCVISVRQKQFNLFLIQSQNTQFSLYFVSQVVIQNERLHKLITLQTDKVSGISDQEPNMSRLVARGPLWRARGESGVIWGQWWPQLCGWGYQGWPRCGPTQPGLINYGHIPHSHMLLGPLW